MFDHHSYIEEQTIDMYNIITILADMSYIVIFS